MTLGGNKLSKKPNPRQMPMIPPKLPQRITRHSTGIPVKQIAKVAAPTSVILMAFNAIAGFALQVWFFQDFNPTVDSYWLAAIPVVVVGAPLGAMLCSVMARETIAYILITLILVELITSLVLIPLTPTIIGFSILVLVIASWLNYQMYNNKNYEI